MEKGVSLLTQKHSLLERVCKIEEKKQELGFSTGTDLSEKKLAVSEGAKELQSAKDGLTLLKRQLNDLMGREIDEELIITPPELTRTIETAPAYSEELLKTATDKNYKLKTLRRDKQQAESSISVCSYCSSSACNSTAETSPSFADFCCCSHSIFALLLASFLF